MSYAENQLSFQEILQIPTEEDSSEDQNQTYLLISQPPHITRSITWVTQESNRGYNLTLHNATDGTTHNLPVEFIEGHWYTLIRHPTIQGEYYAYNDSILAHRQFGTGFPLRDDPYHPDYEPFCITLTPAVSP